MTNLRPSINIEISTLEHSYDIYAFTPVNISVRKGTFSMKKHLFIFYKNAKKEEYNPVQTGTMLKHYYASVNVQKAGWTH